MLFACQGFADQIKSCKSCEVVWTCSVPIKQPQGTACRRPAHRSRLDHLAPLTTPHAFARELQSLSHGQNTRIVVHIA